MRRLGFPAATQPRIVPEVQRMDYEMRVVIRHRRAWSAMKQAERAEVLLASAAKLDEYAAQMREEAEMLTGDRGES